jgi:hypothetical protein
MADPFTEGLESVSCPWCDPEQPGFSIDTTQQPEPAAALDNQIAIDGVWDTETTDSEAA